MLRKLTAAGVFVLALAPSAYLAWTLRAMPHLGFYHDDSIYWVSAKSLAEGHEYRIDSLPGQPYQTKYPPLYPALLAGIWKINPNFPANLPLATLFAWLLLPVYLAMVWVFLRYYGFSWRDQCVLVLVAGLSPVAAMFSFSLMPELLFTALLLASVLLAERALSDGTPRWLPVLAGVCGALAYLTKSAAGPLLLTAPLYFVWRKQFAKGRAVLRSDAAGDGRLAVVGDAPRFEILGSGDALLHQLSRIPDLQRPAARPAAGAVAQPGRLSSWARASCSRSTFLMAGKCWNA